MVAQVGLDSVNAPALVLIFLLGMLAEVCAWHALGFGLVAAALRNYPKTAFDLTETREKQGVRAVLG